jgi:hypothetical protein
VVHAHSDTHTHTQQKTMSQHTRGRMSIASLPLVRRLPQTHTTYNTTTHHTAGPLTRQVMGSRTCHADVKKLMVRPGEAKLPWLAACAAAGRLAAPNAHRACSASGLG